MHCFYCLSAVGGVGQEVDVVHILFLSGPFNLFTLCFEFYEMTLVLDGPLSLEFHEL